MPGNTGKFSIVEVLEEDPFVIKSGPLEPQNMDKLLLQETSLKFSETLDNKIQKRADSMISDKMSSIHQKMTASGAGPLNLFKVT
jgi:hypothetical protein